MLEVKNLSVSYGAIEAVKDISFTVNDGEIVSLIGANGAGKTTTLHTITGLVPAKSGSVMYNGVDLLKTHNNKIVTLGMAHIPEGRHVFTRMSVEENLEMGAFSLKDQSDLKKDLDMVYGLFPRLKERRNQKAGTLSGGEQQMLAMGRALMSHPKTILMVDRRPRIRAGNRPYHDGRRRQGTAQQRAGAQGVSGRLIRAVSALSAWTHPNRQGFFYIRWNIRRSCSLHSGAPSSHALQ